MKLIWHLLLTISVRSKSVNGPNELRIWANAGVPRFMFRSQTGRCFRLTGGSARSAKVVEERLEFGRFQFGAAGLEFLLQFRLRAGKSDRMILVLWNGLRARRTELDRRLIGETGSGDKTKRTQSEWWMMIGWVDESHWGLKNELNKKGLSLSLSLSLSSFCERAPTNCAVVWPEDIWLNWVRGYLLAMMRSTRLGEQTKGVII